jgi:hypothetical protein
MQVGKWWQFEEHLESPANFLGPVLQAWSGSNSVACPSGEKITSLENIRKSDCLITLSDFQNF